MTIGGAANLGMAIKEPSIFKSAKTLKSMSEDSFEGGKPELTGEVPPIIDDTEEAEQIADTSDSASELIQSLTTGNFFIGIILGGSMQYLWGMIRALQMISLTGLVNVKIPIHLHIFLQVCVVFAGMDILDG